MTIDAMRAYLVANLPGFDAQSSDAAVVAAYAALLDAAPTSEPVTLDQIKADLRLDPLASDQDANLERYIVAARRMVELRTSRRFAGDGADLTGDDRMIGGMAISAIVAHWFANPEAVVVDVKGLPTELPLSAGWMIEALRRWDDGA